MATKCTMLIQAGTLSDTTGARRLAGFSESWYSLSALNPGLIGLFTTLARKRAGLLSTFSSIVGMRFQATDGIISGASTTRGVQIQGSYSPDADIPGMSLKFDLDADGTPNQRIWEMRGVPDSVISGGEYANTPAYNSAIQSFFAEISNGWLFRGQLLTAVPTPIFSISALGVITWQEAPAYLAGQMVKILRTKNSANRGKGGVYKLLTITGDTGTLRGWNHGDCTGGKSRLYSIIFPAIGPYRTTFPQPTATHHRPGRPFDLYRGRRAAKIPG